MTYRDKIDNKSIEIVEEHYISISDINNIMDDVEDEVNSIKDVVEALLKDIDVLSQKLY